MAITSAFIDGGHFYDGLRGQGYSSDLDYMGLVRELAGNENLNDVTFYMAVFPDQPYPDKQRNQIILFERLQAQNIRVVQTTTEVREAIFIEQGVETALAVDMVEGALTSRFKEALLISRRAGLIPALRAVGKTKCKVTAAFFEYAIDPGNVLGTVAASAQIITDEQVIRHTKSGPVPLGAVGAVIGRTI